LKIVTKIEVDKIDNTKCIVKYEKLGRYRIRILYPFTDGAYAEDANSTNSTKALDHVN